MYYRLESIQLYDILFGQSSTVDDWCLSTDDGSFSFTLYLQFALNHQS